MKGNTGRGNSHRSEGELYKYIDHMQGHHKKKVRSKSKNSQVFGVRFEYLYRSKSEGSSGFLRS